MIAPNWTTTADANLGKAYKFLHDGEPSEDGTTWKVYGLIKWENPPLVTKEFKVIKPANPIKVEYRIAVSSDASRVHELPFEIVQGQTEIFYDVENPDDKFEFTT